MHFSRWVAALLASACLTGAHAQIPQPAPPELVPYVVDHAGRGQSQIDMRGLLDAPAGKHGFISVRDGHFAYPDGRRFRCWGVNITGWAPGSALLPPHAEAEIFARSLASLGVNCVRLHFLDMPRRSRKIDGEGGSGSRIPITQTPSGLIDDSKGDSRHFDPEQVDRLHYFYAELKKNGIYVDFNLNVGRMWRAGDGVPDHDLIGVAKGVTYFGPELIERQKEYARMLLGMRNPYTGMRYADDPAVMIVEIVNENSLLEFWQRNWLRGERQKGAENLQLDLPPHYAALLTRQYNGWLAANRSAAEVAEIRRVAGVAAGAPVPFLRRGDFRAAPALRYRAEIGFITSVEYRFHAEMTKFLREELGVKAVIMPTADHTYFIAGQPMMRSGSRFDVMDSHVYWQHPAIYGKRNEPMVNSPELSILTKLARTAMTGKAFTVSEVNHPFPADYGAEMIPILAAYAALQDWDGIFFYTFEAKLNGVATPMIGDHFDITQDPVKIAQLPVGAALFLRHDVAPARQVVGRAYSTEQIDESARMPRAAMPYFSPGFDPRLPLVHGSRVACLDCKRRDAPPLPAGDVLAADTGELVWRTADGKDGIVTIDTPLSQALVGFLPANAKVVTTHLGADLANRFAAITLTALDGKPVYRSDTMLLTLTGRTQNSGAEWNERRTMLTKWGTAPTLIEPITGWVTLRDLDGALGVFAMPLDGAGRAMGPEQRARMVEPGWELAVGTPATTSYRLRIVR
ncbi:hypothetical protein FHS96_003509 [Sphingomonas zeicaulis]|uniref:hypothetical protein n=1 Tax=Sphingomonas zeicaulis TaxID=1632740 RepID=UPI003D201AFE